MDISIKEHYTEVQAGVGDVQEHNCQGMKYFIVADRTSRGKRIKMFIESNLSVLNKFTK